MKSTPFCAVTALAFSPDVQQQFLYVASTINGCNHVSLLKRDTLAFKDHIDLIAKDHVTPVEAHDLAVDSKGNIYIIEDYRWRSNKFVPPAGSDLRF